MANVWVIHCCNEAYQQVAEVAAEQQDPHRMGTEAPAR
jgi:hypothetical protein